MGLLHAITRLVEPSDRTCHVHFYHLVVLREVKLLVADSWHHSARIDQKIQAPELSGDLLEKCGHLIEVMNVVSESEDFPRMVCRHDVQLVLTPSDRGHETALLGEDVHQLGTDSR